MQDKRITEIEGELLFNSDSNGNMRDEIVNALKEGQVWQERFEVMEKNIDRVIEIGFFKHYTVENIRNLIENIKDQNPLEEELKLKKPQGLYESMIDQMAIDYIKKLMSKVFSRLEEYLEKE